MAWEHQAIHGAWSWPTAPLALASVVQRSQSPSRRPPAQSRFYLLAAFPAFPSSLPAHRVREKTDECVGWTGKTGYRGE
ncbi:hypothetical protein M440DRAFT_1404286 [Trichoderma longibrachiatum ATCC 18648]|uniref:Uncharacterized protein n=1 Tax=Trichoderma longibrachiatum ATCC 18648 TaxID=983965 RepID=A0A2T4BXM3_TRILO|nr:hypothetical protein M440DRAFT_1404286 [Trichoderma longibrachiatum ATCC 18648]